MKLRRVVDLEEVLQSRQILHKRDKRPRINRGRACLEFWRVVAEITLTRVSRWTTNWSGWERHRVVEFLHLSIRDPNNDGGNLVRKFGTSLEHFALLDPFKVESAIRSEGDRPTTHRKWSR